MVSVRTRALIGLILVSVLQFENASRGPFRVTGVDFGLSIPDRNHISQESLIDDSQQVITEQREVPRPALGRIEGADEIRQFFA